MDEFDNHTEPYEDPYVSGPIRKIILGTFIPLFPLTICGNCLVICVIVRNRSMRTVTNFFLANLAVADLMVAIFCIIPQMMWFVSPTWSLGAVMCKLHKYMLGVTTNASIFIMMAISGERFVAIIYPLRIRRVLTIGRLSCILCFLWLLSFLLSIPSFQFFDESTDSNGTKQCGVSLNISSYQVRVHNIFNFNFCYLLPLFVMMFFYARIIVSLWLRGRAVYYRTSRHGEKTSTPSAAVEMEVRMHTGGSIKTHPHRHHHHHHSHAHSSESKKIANEQCNGKNEVKAVQDHTEQAEDAGSLKIGPFFVDYPPSSPRRNPDAFKGSKSCENMFLLGGGEKARGPHAELARTKSQSTGAIDHYHQQFCKALNSEDQEEEIELDVSVHATFINEVMKNGNAVPVKDVNKPVEEHSLKENKHIYSKPRPIRQRSSGKIPVKNGYEFLSTIEDDELLTETPAATTNTDPTEQPNTSESPQRPKSFPNALKRCAKKAHTRLSEFTRRPTVLVEMVPADNHSTNSRTPNRPKKISKSTIATRKKVIRMLVVLVVAFGVCLFPMELLSLWTVVGTFPYFSKFGILFVPFTYLAYFFNSALNPFLYALLSDNFRMRMRETLDFRGSSRRARWMRTQTRLRSLTSEGTDNDWVA
ncbi:uncharacterized protein LOC129280605 [Lytechinus pictus]|uniref:uncharacterized protein LOC129280605 n=1 Tax=Lytechinus pictus TaxID=7653 RepID=UPI0030B9FB47